MFRMDHSLSLSLSLSLIFVGKKFNAIFATSLQSFLRLEVIYFSVGTILSKQIIFKNIKLYLPCSSMMFARSPQIIKSLKNLRIFVNPFVSISHSVSIFLPCVFAIHHLHLKWCLTTVVIPFLISYHLGVVTLRLLNWRQIFFLNFSTVADLKNVAGGR